MSITTNQNRDEAQEILEALRQIQDSPELQAAAATEPESVFNRLKLSGIARHAVAFAIAGIAVVPLAASPQGFWGG